MEQIRIIKEMRENDRRSANKHRGMDVKPRFMVWENVPGAFSSGTPKGADFQAVLEEICKVVVKDCPTVPMPDKGWPKAGCISGMGDDGISFSVAWRLHDAQFWGVPQRRKRISLIADFGGLAAPEILFERKSVSGDTAENGGERQGIATDAQSSVDLSDRPFIQVVYESHGQDSRYREFKNDICETMSAKYGNGGGNVPMVLTKYIFRKKGHPQNSTQGQGYELANVSDTLNVFDNTEARTPILILENGNTNIRKLTPRECERLQGFPDDWTGIGEWIDTNGKRHKESDFLRYRALGNSIALPFWDWLAERICKQYDRPVEMASLFDGIGGFPLVFEKHGGKAVWASEIEEFPIAVTKIRFPEDEFDL